MNGSNNASRRRDAIGTVPMVRRIEVWERGLWHDTHEGPGLTVAEAMRQELAGWPEGYSGGGLTFWEDGRMVGYVVVDDGRVTATALDGSEMRAGAPHGMAM